MQDYILLKDLPKEGYNKGCILEFPEDELSILIKGKGFFIQIYKDSELVTNKFPDILFLPKKYEGGYEKKPTIHWNKYRLLNVDEIPEKDYGTYVLFSTDDAELKQYIGTSYKSYEVLIRNGYIPIDLKEQSSIRSGDLVVRIYQDGKRIPGIALANRMTFNLNHEAFNIFYPLVQDPEYGATKYPYAKGGDNFFYQKMYPEELDNLTIKNSKEEYLKFISSLDGNNYTFIVDRENMKLIKQISEQDIENYEDKE